MCSPRKSIALAIKPNDSRKVREFDEYDTQPLPVSDNDAGPAPVHKLGHFGMCVTDFAKAYQFYTTHFNFKASNVSSTNVAIS